MKAHLDSTALQPGTYVANVQILEDGLGFVPDDPRMTLEGDVLVIHDVMIRTEVRLEIRDVETQTSRLKMSAIGVLASMIDGLSGQELCFNRCSGVCTSTSITTPHKARHIQEIEVSVLAWEDAAAGSSFTLGRVPRTARGRLPIKIIRVPDGGD